MTFCPLLVRVRVESRLASNGGALSITGVVRSTTPGLTLPRLQQTPSQQVARQEPHRALPLVSVRCVACPGYDSEAKESFT